MNAGTDYSESTVFLTSAIDFTGYSDTFVPAGNSSAPFNGVFNGQGHVISNLTVKMPVTRLGLIGYSTGATVMNVVVDDTCSFEDTSSQESYVSGIFAYCYASTVCTADSNVNMASIKYSGTTEKNVYLGGIVGSFSTFKVTNVVKNSVNYGAITCTGTAKVDNLAGVIGSMNNVLKDFNQIITNCANYGTISHTGKTFNYTIIGGILGFGRNNIITNCFASGDIQTNQATEYIGLIIAQINTATQVTQCHWTRNINNINIAGEKASMVTISSSTRVEMNRDTLDAINTYAKDTDSSWSGWLILHLNNGTICGSPYDEIITTQKNFPTPEKDGYTFVGWYKDATFTDKYRSLYDNVTDLYAKYELYVPSTHTLIFEFNNGQKAQERSLSLGATITYPSDP